ncbi:TM2 domain-containing protein [Pelistega suis]|uniref:TM2 domain-containing protein n=1 Tax=Pelistega suis TaxID=1631957 RepID=UPI00211C6391|nr:TM2 domain-containing protein [Pelistega suis]MCQ9328874.1 TM2 domain-containing protein [Pelistega suis]
MQKILIPIVIFIAVLIALMFGEGLLVTLFNFLENIFGFVFEYWRDFYAYAYDFIQANPFKLLLAIIITVIASFWVFSKHGDELNAPGNRRKIAIILAIFLGWLGAHRFYLNQYGKGILYIILSMIFAPLTVLVSFIDAARFAFSTDEEFKLKYRV